MKTETIEATIENWTNEPSGARGTPTVTARGEEAQAVMEAGSFTWRADNRECRGRSFGEQEVLGGEIEPEAR